MRDALVILSVLVVLGTAGLFLSNLFTRKYDVISIRNLFLLGFMHFFGVGTYFAARSGAGTESYVPGDQGYSLLFITMGVFIVVFAIAQRLGSRWSGLRRVIPPVELPVTRLGILVAIAALVFAAIVCSVIPNTGYTAAIISQFRGGTAAAAIALATYNLLARKFNPIAWGVFLGTLVCTLLLSTVGEIGRRGMLGVFLAIAWIWFYFSLRDRSPTSTLLKMGTFLACGLIVLLIYAGFRGKGFANDGSGRGYTLATRVQQFADAVVNPTVESSNVQSALKSDTPTNSMFILENYPANYAYDPFNGVKFIVTNPIPRSIYPNKPKGLGITLQEHLQSAANLGVGIIGHGWAEGGFFGVIGYAAFFGLLVAGVDTLIRRRVWNPYFMAAIGSSLGNVCALPRGETSLFLLQIMLSFFGVIAVLNPLRLVLGPILAASPLLLTDANRHAFEPPAEEAHLADEYTAYDAYGSDAVADTDYHPAHYRGAVSS